MIARAGKLETIFISRCGVTNWMQMLVAVHVFWTAVSRACASYSIAQNPEDHALPRPAQQMSFAQWHSDLTTWNGRQNFNSEAVYGHYERCD